MQLPLEEREGYGGRHWANDYSKVVNLNGKSKKILHKKNG